MIGREEGRSLFGCDPETYDSARPGHPEWVYERLVERCGLGPGTSVVEVGPGTGQATRELLELGARPLVAIEPNGDLAALLENRFGERVEVVEATLEADGALEAEAFDLAAAASSFHWIDEDAGLARLYDCLRPGGWVALWWTLFGDGEPKDAFMRAVDPLLVGLLRSPSSGRGDGRPAFALDVTGRTAALEGAGFVDVSHELARWTATWDTAGIRDLYGTFSPVRRLDVDRREALLTEVARIAEQDFGGRVTRRLTTSLYVAQKRP